MDPMICRNCGTISKPEHTDPRGGCVGTGFIVVGSIFFLALVFFWFLGLGVACIALPLSAGVIGIGWWLKNRKPPLHCAACQTTGTMLPLQSPVGQDLAKRFHPNTPASN